MNEIARIYDDFCDAHPPSEPANGILSACLVALWVIGIVVAAVS